MAALTPFRLVPAPVPKPKRLKVDTLSKREFEVASCAASGWSNPQIAQKLGIRSTSVRNVMKWVFVKLDIRSRLELVQSKDQFKVTTNNEQSLGAAALELQRQDEGTDGGSTKL